MGTFLEQVWSDVEGTGKWFGHFIDQVLNLGTTGIETVGDIAGDVTGTVTSISSDLAPNGGGLGPWVIIGGVAVLGFFLLRG